MTIRLTYKYSNLDKEHKFGLTFMQGEAYEAYIRWVWFYLGERLANRKFALYPFDLNDGKILKEYQFYNDAEKQAKFIANKILKKEAK